MMRLAAMAALGFVADAQQMDCAGHATLVRSFFVSQYRRAPLQPNRALVLALVP